jgi:DNA polymerase III epsilon subunit-like protein
LIRVIDIETLGIDPATDAIIEIASVDMVRGGVRRCGRAHATCPRKPKCRVALEVSVHCGESSRKDIRDACS